MPASSNKHDTYAVWTGVHSCPLICDSFKFDYFNKRQTQKKMVLLFNGHIRCGWALRRRPDDHKLIYK